MRIAWTSPGSERVYSSTVENRAVISVTPNC
jgi:hypothetical protein